MLFCLFSPSAQLPETPHSKKNGDNERLFQPRRAKSRKERSKMPYTDIHAYFKKHMKRASNSGRAANVWLRSADALVRGGVKTMGELAGIGSDVDFIRHFINFESPGRELDAEGYDFASKMRSKHSRERHKAQLLAAGEVLVEEYFSAHCPRDAPKGATARASKSLRNAGIETMRQLAEATPERIAMVRVMGGKTLPIALVLREKYINELRIENLTN